MYKLMTYKQDSMLIVHTHRSVTVQQQNITLTVKNADDLLLFINCNTNINKVKHCQKH